MRRIFAIAGLTFRVAARSRILALLAVLIAASTLALPFIMKGDGTPEGTVKLYLHYALGWSMFLVSVGALWSGAGSLSQEVEDRQIQLVTTKPVLTFHLWLGKWLGLMLLNASLLALAGLLSYGMLRWATRPSRLPERDQLTLREDILVARRALAAEPDSVEVRVDETGAPLYGGHLGAGPGGELRWRFKVPNTLREDDYVLLQYKFASSRLADTAPYEMRWTAGSASDPERFSTRVFSSAGMPHSIRVPAPAFEPGQEACIAFHNEESERPAFILFSAEAGVNALIRVGGFEMNFVRSLLVLFARLALFSALGLAAGALFSFPVASFVSLAFLLTTFFSRFVQTLVSAGPGTIQEQAGITLSPLWDAVVRCALAAVGFILPPLWRYEPLDALTSGGLVSWQLVASAFLVLAGACSAAPALLSGWLFSRRQLGLPS